MFTIDEYKRIYSVPRIEIYIKACHGDENKAILLYEKNRIISSMLQSILIEFEILLRNKIDNHYIKKWGDDWLLKSAQVNGFLTKDEKNKKTAEKIIEQFNKYDLKNQYNHNKLLSDLPFSIWEYLFAYSQFRAGGSSLLKIFEKKKLPKMTTQNKVKKIINAFVRQRNNTSHGSQICLLKMNNGDFEISTIHLREILKDASDMLNWMNIPNVLTETYIEIEKLLDELDLYK